MVNYFFKPNDHIQFSDEKMKKVNLYESKQMFCDVYCLKPEQFQKDHDHAANDKIYYVLSGTCSVRIGDETQELSEGEMAVAPAGVIHGVKNTSNDDCSLLVMMAPHPNFQG